jgi:hypothetical protein
MTKFITVLKTILIGDRIARKSYIFYKTEIKSSIYFITIGEVS